MTDDLITWFRAVLDEDERVARDDWEFRGEEDPWPGTPPMIAAERAILDRAVELRRLAQSRPGYDPVARLNVSLAKVLAPELDRIVRLLASAYSSRPGYRPEWRP